MKNLSKYELYNHLVNLDSSDRYLRFLSTMNNDGILRYVENISKDDLVIGIIKDEKVVSALHAHISENVCEFGISTLIEYRGNGYAKILLEELFKVCYEQQLSKIVCICLRSNNWMIKIAKNYSMNLEFDGSTCWAEKQIENLDHN